VVPDISQIEIRLNTERLFCITPFPALKPALVE
jgi:hypothetical protein